MLLKYLKETQKNFDLEITQRELRTDIHSGLNIISTRLLEEGHVTIVQKERREEESWEGTWSTTLASALD